MSEVMVDTNAIRQLSSNLQEVQSSLTLAKSAMQGAELDGSVFSDLGIALGQAHRVARDFAEHDAQEQSEQVGSIQERLNQTAQVWDDAESHSTVTEC